MTRRPQDSAPQGHPGPSPGRDGARAPDARSAITICYGFEAGRAHPVSQCPMNELASTVSFTVHFGVGGVSQMQSSEVIIRVRMISLEIASHGLNHI